MKKEAGFTLMEILIAVAIMGILAGVGFSSFTNSFMRSRDSQRKSELSEIQRALELHVADFGLYPAANASHKITGCYSVETGVTDCEWGAEFSFQINDTIKVYMKQLPEDPSAPGFTYQYYVSSDRKSYQLFARLENTEDPALVENLLPVCAGAELCNYGVTSSNTSITETLL